MEAHLTALLILGGMEAALPLERPSHMKSFIQFIRALTYLTRAGQTPTSKLNIKAPLTMHQTISGRGFTTISSQLLIAMAFAISGCASAPPPVKLEPKLVAQSIGFPNCDISVPLTQAEWAELGRKVAIYPNPAEDPEWARLVAFQQPGDELRRVSCRDTNIHSYVLVRKGEVVFKFDMRFFD